MSKIKKTIQLGQKILSEAKRELNEEREKNLKARAKVLLADIQEAKRTVNLLEKQLENFMREVNLED